MAENIKAIGVNVDTRPINMNISFSSKARKTYRDGEGRTVREPSIKMMIRKPFSLDFLFHRRLISLLSYMMAG